MEAEVFVLTSQNLRKLSDAKLLRGAEADTGLSASKHFAVVSCGFAWLFFNADCYSFVTSLFSLFVGRLLLTEYGLITVQLLRTKNSNYN